MAEELKIPEVGESVSEAEIGRWLKAEGDSVEKHETVAELETDKVTVELPAPVDGVLSKIVLQEGETGEVGDVIAYIETGDDAGDSKEESKRQKEEEQQSEESKKQKGKKGEARDKQDEEEDGQVDDDRDAEEKKDAADDGDRQESDDESADDKPSDEDDQDEDEEDTQSKRERQEEGKDGEKKTEEKDKEDEEPEDTGEDAADTEAPDAIEVHPRVMPAAREALVEHDLHVDDVEGTGPGGRVTPKDVRRTADRKESADEDDEDRPRESDDKKRGRKQRGDDREQTQQKPALRTGDAKRDEHRERMSRLRRRVAERLVDAQNTGAFVTTFNEVDMTEVMRIREKHGDAFEKEHNVKLGLMSFFVRATINALHANPRLNARIEDEDQVITPNYCDIGIAVSTDRGLLVPVLRDSDRMSFARIERTIQQLADAARDGDIKVEQLEGGTFTITNGGVFGSLLSTPIINPPQTAVLGMHTIQRRPVADESDEVVVRPMMYLALTYDHRLIDGAEAVTFLKHIKEAVETPYRLLIDSPQSK